MHVLLEGVLPLEIKLLLYNFTSIQKLFSVDDFNSRLEAFQFGYSESKPSRIDLSHLSDGNLHQSGMLYNLPLSIRHSLTLQNQNSPSTCTLSQSLLTVEQLLYSAFT